MKISLNWLNDFIDLQKAMNEGVVTPAALAEKLTFAGLEVESITQQKEALRSVVVGLILKKEAHSNSDRLSVCQVTTGEGVVHQIVCGAQNHKEGDRVAVALPGAQLPNGMKIAKTVIRDVSSNGMLCSAQELAVQDVFPEQKEGILILDQQAQLGQEFADYSGLNDVVYELKVTPNRADVLSHFGLARELSVLLQMPLTNSAAQEVPFPESQMNPGIPVSNQDPEACWTYSGRVVAGVKNQQSPAWMQKRLAAVGQKSINLLVDVTNYVMFEFGQPLHAFDLKKIRQNKIEVRRAQDREEMITFDGTVVKFKGDELLICDGEGPVALGGVVGSSTSGISEDTENIFVEAAHFAPASVRRTARRHGIQTESAHRFMRGVDAKGVRRALDRACQLYQELAHGKVGEVSLAKGKNQDEAQSVLVRSSNVKKILGIEITDSQFESFLQRMQFSFQKTGDGFVVEVPSFRVDIENEADFAEEYARLIGYNQIPERLPTGVGVEPKAHDEQFLVGQKVSRILQGYGFFQGVFSALISDKDENALGMSLQGGQVVNDAKPVRLLNPISEDLNTLRRTQVAGMLAHCERQLSYGESRGKIFSLGPVWNWNGSPLEENHFALSYWSDELDRAQMVLEMKVILLELFRQFGLEVELKVEKSVPFLHPGRAGRILSKQGVLAVFGELHPQWSEKKKLRSNLVLAEGVLPASVGPALLVPKVKQPSKFQKVTRDLAFVMKDSTPAGDLIKRVWSMKLDSLEEIRVKSVYKGQPLAEFEKSVAYEFHLRGTDRTLADNEVAASMDLIQKTLVQEFNLRLR